MKVVNFVNKAFKNLDKRRIVVSIIFGGLFSCFLVLGAQFNANKELSWTIWTALCLLMFTFAFSVVLFFLLNLKIKLKTDKNFKPKKWKIFFVLMLITIVFFLIMYPGNYEYDIIHQQLAFKTGEYNTHFPPAFCFLSGILIEIGKFFGGDNVGIAFYLLIQATLTNFIITKVITDLSGRLKNKTFFSVSLFYFILHPFVFNLMLSTCHDVIFGDLFVLLLLEFLNMSEDEKYFCSAKNQIKVLFLTFAMCIFRNNGLYALIPTLIIGLIFMKKYRKKLLLFLGIPMIAFSFGYNIFFLDIIHVYRQSVVHESMNVPVMQIARALYYNYPKVWSEELNKYFREQCNWAAYGKYQAISDGYKVCMDDDSVKDDFLGFIKYWAKIGIKSPKQYIEAPGMLMLNLYYPWVTYNEKAHDNIINGPYTEYRVISVEDIYAKKGVAMPTRNSVFPAINEKLEKFFNHIWARIPVFRVIWSAAFSTILFLIMLAFVIYRKNSRYVLPIAFIFGLILTVALAPVVLFRYMFPVVLATPVMLYIILKTVVKLKK